MERLNRFGLLLVLLAITRLHAVAQVSSYTFSQTVGTWQPIAGNGTPMGMPGLPPPFTFDDNSFVSQGEAVPIGSVSSGNGWPIGFNFTFNGHSFDRVGLSMEGWLAFGNSADGIGAVYVPVGPDAYQPLTSTPPGTVDPRLRNRVAGFAMDLAAMGNGGTWPLQIMTAGQAPDRYFVAEWNVVRSGGSNAMNFQVRLNEGGGDPAQQTVQVIYGTMLQISSLQGQVGLAGNTADDFNNRAVTASPFDWGQSVAGTTNTATCRPPATTALLPQGLTFTWTPVGCSVTGITVDQLTIANGTISGSLSWGNVPGATNYSYVITVGGPNDPALLSGSGITGSQVPLTGLPADQNLFAYVAADCGQGTQSWGGGTPFTTTGLVEVPCGSAPLSFTHCYDNLEQRTWSYTATSDAPLRMVINDGTLLLGDVLTIYDGANDQAPLLFTSTSGAIAGQVVNSTGAHLYMKLISNDQGSCATQEFVLPMEWEVGCLDCDPVFANFTVEEDCDNGQFMVDVELFSMGSATEVVIGSDANAATVTANGVGSYVLGPFPIDVPVFVTAAHPENAYCDAVSMPLLNELCPVVGCGPDVYEHCYANGEQRSWAFSGEQPNDRIGVRFLAGSLGSGDVINVYDGTDPVSSPPLGTMTAGDLTNMVFISELGNSVLLELLADGSGGCDTGETNPWQFVVECDSGCMPPQAQFAVVDDCTNEQFSVLVNITSMGSAGSVVLTNNAGLSVQTVNLPGAYSIGPVANGAEVVVGVAGANALCSLNSLVLTDGCSVGVDEAQRNDPWIYPATGGSMFNLALPHGFGGDVGVVVLDPAGRRVQQVRVSTPLGQVIPLDLRYVAAGSYVVVVQGANERISAKVSVLH